MDSVESLVTSARKRSIANLIAEQAAAGLCAALAGFLLLLIAGSDALAWPWLVLLFGGGAAWSAYRTWQGLPSLYEVAQRIDRRLNLSDTISTAIAFPSKPEQASEAVWRLQREAAKNASAAVTSSEAAPYRMPRQAKWLGGLLAATVILLAIRFGVLGSLDLSHPLVAGLSNFLPAKIQEGLTPGLIKGQSQANPGDENQQKSEDKQEEKQDAKGDNPQDSPQMQGDNQNAMGDPQQGDDQQQPGDDQQPGTENQMQQASDQRDGKQSDSQKQANNNDQNPSESNQQQASNNQPNDQKSMMDKLRDSLANLMNKMQPQKNGQNQKQNQNQQQQQGDQKDSQANQQQGQGEQREQSAEQQQGKSQKDPSADQNQTASTESNQKAPSNDPKTGHGTQDGKKELDKQAKQLEAMGKLTELIGERSKALEGEIMMDRKASQAHDLKTAYQDKNSFHRDAGSDLRRDEIPVEFQHYIQQYFAKIRQAPAAPKKN